MHILDTNVLAELRTNKPNPSQAVRSWASQQPLHQLYLSAITAMELEVGVRRMERRAPAQGAHLRIWADQALAQFQDRILPVTAEIALLCAGLHVPHPKSLADSLIAATALAHGFTVVTRNVSDYAGTGVAICNPWETG